MLVLRLTRARCTGRKRQKERQVNERVSATDRPYRERNAAMGWISDCGFDRTFFAWAGSKLECTQPREQRRANKPSRLEAGQRYFGPAAGEDGRAESAVGERSQSGHR